MGLEWRGEQVKAKVIAASLAAVTETTAAAAEEAKRDHWWENRTRHLQHETISDIAHRVPGGVAGKFGTTRRRGFYGLFLELKHPFLRPVADRIFPTLAERLRRRYNA